LYATKESHAFPDEAGLIGRDMRHAWKVEKKLQILDVKTEGKRTLKIWA
jgi:hypothetical protein